MGGGVRCSIYQNISVNCQFINNCWRLKGWEIYQTSLFRLWQYSFMNIIKAYLDTNQEKMNWEQREMDMKMVWLIIDNYADCVEWIVKKLRRNSEKWSVPAWTQPSSRTFGKLQTGCLNCVFSHFEIKIFSGAIYLSNIDISNNTFVHQFSTL